MTFPELVRVSEARVVGRVEAVGERGGEAVLLRLARARQRNRQGVLLAHVAHVERVLDATRLAGDALGTTGWVGSADEIRSRAKEAEAAGATEILYTPTGDFERELRTFAAAVRG